MEHNLWAHITASVSSQRQGQGAWLNDVSKESIQIRLRYCNNKDTILIAETKIIK